MPTDGKTITCPFCGTRFTEEESAKCCTNCAMFGSGGCKKLRCPNCSYEMPAPARLPGLLARVFKRGGKV